VPTQCRHSSKGFVCLIHLILIQQHFVGSDRVATCPRPHSLGQWEAQNECHTWALKSVVFGRACLLTPTHVPEPQQAHPECSPCALLSLKVSLQEGSFPVNKPASHHQLPFPTARAERRQSWLVMVTPKALWYGLTHCPVSSTPSPLSFPNSHTHTLCSSLHG
jgi:hypothetical protein